MGSLTVSVGSVSFKPLVHASRSRRRANCICRSVGSAPAARSQMAMLASIVAFPASGRNFALIQAAKVRFLSLSSPARSRIRCNAESGQDDYPRRQPDSPDRGTEFVENRGSNGVVAEDRKKQYFERLREDLQVRRRNFWSDFKEQHVVYKRDRDRWGLGLSPIFTVHEDEEGNRYQVDVNEDEILRRSGVDPHTTQFADEECKLLAEERIEHARAHAIDIQQGLVNPSPFSIVYEYKRRGASSTSSFGNGSWPGSSLTLPAGAPWQFLSLLIPLLSLVLLGIGVKLLFSRRRQEEDGIVKEKNMRSMQMRKLKAQMGRESSTGTIGSIFPTPQERENGVPNRAVTPGEEGVQDPEQIQYSVDIEEARSGVDDDEFRRKVLEIQAMARNARLQEQERAEAVSTQTSQRNRFLESKMKQGRRLGKLTKDLDDFHRLGAENSDGPDLVPNEEKSIPAVENGQSSTSEIVGSGSLLRPGTLSSRLVPNSPKSTGMRPRIILSAEEARVRIAAKRVKSNASSSTSASSKPEFGRSKVGFGQSNNDLGKAPHSEMETSTSTNSIEQTRSVNATSLSAKESSEVLSGGVLDTSSYRETPAAGVSNDCHPETSVTRPMEKINNSATVRNEGSSNCENVNINRQERTEDREARDTGRERGQLKSKDEEEEMEWMRDDVLRAIVFKVQANEEAGREPFHSLNSEQETLFFKGLERKFEREGDQVKKWIKDRVENIDYGSNGISVFDPPESYELKWKEGVERASKSEFYNRFSKDRHRIINEKRGLIYPSPSVSEQLSPTDSTEESQLSSSPAPCPSSSTTPPSPVSSSHTPLSRDLDTTHGRSRENLSGDGKAKVVVSSSPRPGKATDSFPSTRPGAQTGEAGKEDWDHTKRWAKDLERKYAMETDPATRALMRELGQDLERWITEDEIEAASRMLDNGLEGEEEYVKMHYERTKEKIKRQREVFGRDAMLNKYSEYKEEAEEVELWWLSLPFVVCIGLRATVEGELRTGLYSVDVAPALDGVAGVPSVAYHTVAFQDRGDAQNFCTLINSQPENLNAAGAEPVPFDPKDLYNDAKSEGFRVTVIKKGQLQLSVDKPFDEVESRILELGSARYFEELMCDRMIDMDAVVDDGLGFGRDPR
ncbi:unnamed protein product [Calypogeia fissa]